MIPQTTAPADDVYNKLPSLTYGLNFATNRIVSRVDDLESVKQAIYLILGTGRYTCLIYDWHYGHELVSLIGQPFDYVVSEIDRVITEALLQDDRITNVSNFKHTKTATDAMLTEFSVDTIFGAVDYEIEVTI